MRGFGLYKIFAIVYFSAMLLSMAHFHQASEDAFAIDCKVCTLSQNLFSTDQPPSPIYLASLKSFIESPFSYKTYLDSSLSKGFDAHAPPLIVL